MNQTAQTKKDISNQISVIRYLKLVTISFLLLTAYCSLPTDAQAASLSVSPSTGTFNKSCDFSVDVLLNTQGASTDGVDAILFYDSTKLNVKRIRKGTIYSDYPQEIIDPANNKVVISGSASASSPYQGNGVLASIDFSVLADATAGVTQVKFDFDPSDKTKSVDSNVAERNNLSDVLSSVTDSSFTIGAGACIGASTGSGSLATGSGVPRGSADDGQTIPLKTLPQGADFNTTLILTSIGGFLTVLGIVGMLFL